MNDRVKHGFYIGHRLGRISEYFISEQIRGSDPDTLRRARTVTHFSLALITAGIFYSIVYVGMGLIESAIQVTLASSIALINIRVLRRTSNLKLAATVLALVLFWILTELALHQGGETSPSLYWYALMPVLATLLSGRRAGLIWTVVTILAHCVFVLGRDFGIQYEQVLPESSQRFWRFLVLVG
ncbi:MAG: hypothetical protein IPK83_12425, partial [Planctomycetes bacterium]|nr:hypothetical protein [Planctomycetota bacterium]